MKLKEVRQLKQGCPCEEVTNKECCEFCGYLNADLGWDCRYCENLKADLTWRDKKACKEATKAMREYEKGNSGAFYFGDKRRTD